MHFLLGRGLTVPKRVGASSSDSRPIARLRSRARARPRSGQEGLASFSRRSFFIHLEQPRLWNGTLDPAMLIFCNTPDESQRGPIVGIVTALECAGRMVLSGIKRAKR